MFNEPTHLYDKNDDHACSKLILIYQKFQVYFLIVVELLVNFSDRLCRCKKMGKVKKIEKKSAAKSNMKKEF